MEDSEIDLHCLEVLNKYRKGKISHEEAEYLLREHGDKLIMQQLKNGFTVSYATVE